MSETICITGAGVVSAFGEGVAAFASGWRHAGRMERAGNAEIACTLDATAMFGKRVAKAHDRVTLLLMAAADLAFRDAGVPTLDDRRVTLADDEVAIVIGTLGSLRSVGEFDLQTLRAPEYVVPTQFPSTVFCAAASYTAIRHAIRESCVTVTNGDVSSLQSFALGADRLTYGRARQVVVGGVEERSDLRARMVATAETDGDRARPLAEGAALFTLERRRDARKRGARELAEVLGGASSFCPDLARAKAANDARLGALVGNEAMRSVRHVIDADVAAARLGRLGAASGAFTVAALLVDRAIEPGSLVKVDGTTPDGSACSLLVRKLRDCGAPERS